MGDAGGGLTVIWKTMGYNMVIFLAGLQDVPQSLHEAAAIDGANSWAALLAHHAAAAAPASLLCARQCR